MSLFHLGVNIKTELTTGGLAGCGETTCGSGRIEVHRAWTASLPPILNAEGRTDRNALFVRMAITCNGKLLFHYALFWYIVKHLVRPGSVGIVLPYAKQWANCTRLADFIVYAVPVDRLYLSSDTVLKKRTKYLYFW